MKERKCPKSCKCLTCAIVTIDENGIISKCKKYLGCNSKIKSCTFEEGITSCNYHYIREEK